MHVKRPADPLDLAAFVQAGGRTLVPLRRLTTLQIQIFGGLSCVVRRNAPGSQSGAGGGAPLAMAGLLPQPGGFGAWFSIAPGLAAGEAARVILALRRELRTEAASAGCLVAEIMRGNVEGERLARALGFSFEDATVMPETCLRHEGVGIWVLKGGSHGSAGSGGDHGGGELRREPPDGWRRQRPDGGDPEGAGQPAGAAHQTEG